MKTYGTCTHCGDLLQITDYAQTTHPGCMPRATRLDYLLADWLRAIEAGDTDTEERLIVEIDTAEQAPPRLADAAQVYAAWGWPIFPLLGLADAVRIAKRQGLPVTKVAKRPATKHGFHDATTDAGRIADYWERHPDANIGVATGHRFDVIDVDTGKGGMDSFRRLLDTPLIPDVHARVSTASSGWHLYIEPLGTGNSADNGRATLPGIDYRGLGGYVVAPPSWLGEHPRRWTWLSKPSPGIRA